MNDNIPIAGTAKGPDINAQGGNYRNAIQATLARGDKKITPKEGVIEEDTSNSSDWKDEDFTV